jgi:thymidylate synthase
VTIMKFEDLVSQRIIDKKIFTGLAPGLGQIPVLSACGRTLAEAWENSLVALYAFGTEVRTDYDRKDAKGKYIDPASKDASMRIIIEQPFGEPMIHRAFPGGIEDLEEYRLEVVEGVKDHWIRNPEDPSDKRWEYTYHERLFSYKRSPREKGIDQIEEVAKALASSPHSRRSQAVTWQVWLDPEIEHPPCLQSLWFRLLPVEESHYRLNMNIRFRSRDAYDAAFMNCFALTFIMEKVARMISEKAGFKVSLGRYVDESDSYHIYGHRLEDFQNRFIRQVLNRPFEERTWTLEFAKPIFEEARPKILEKIKQNTMPKTC